MQPVEGIPPRDVVVMFTAHFFSYNPGEAAYFTADEAQRLDDLGVAGPPPPPTAAFLTGGDFANLDAIVAGIAAVADGGFSITVDGIPRATRQNFTSVTVQNDILTLINSDLSPAAVMTITGTGPTRFVITSGTTGRRSTISYAEPPAAGTDLSAPLLLTATYGATLTQGTGI